MSNRGFAADGRLQLMYGGMDLDQREKIKQAFQAHPEEEGAEVRILLATDTASEGIDLQNHCSKLIHIEIPWNPNVLEQRNGRIDRYGQLRDEVDIYHFVPKGYDHEKPRPGRRSGRSGGRPRVPVARREEGRSDPGRPRQGRTGDRPAGRGSPRRRQAEVDSTRAGPRAAIGWTGRSCVSSATWKRR